MDPCGNRGWKRSTSASRRQDRRARVQRHVDAGLQLALLRQQARAEAALVAIDQQSKLVGMV